MILAIQVHKEALDRVPNSLPTRGNIEIEIYGMEGIPEADLRDHEAQKQCSYLKALTPKDYTNINFINILHSW